MTDKEKKQISQAKIKQILDLAKVLQIEIVMKKRLQKTGYIEDVIVFLDHEVYPEEPANELQNEKQDTTTD